MKATYLECIAEQYRLKWIDNDTDTYHFLNIRLANTLINNVRTTWSRMIFESDQFVTGNLSIH